MRIHDPNYLMKYAAFAAGLADAQYDVKGADGKVTTYSTAMKLATDPDEYIKEVGSKDPDFSDMVHDAADCMNLVPANSNWYYPGKDGERVQGGAVAALREQAETCSRMAAAMMAGTPATAAATAAAIA